MVPLSGKQERLRGFSISEHEFNEWKSLAQFRGSVAFVKRYVAQTMVTNNIFKCSRSGVFVTTVEERKRELKLQCSKKVNAFCPCSI